MLTFVFMVSSAYDSSTVHRINRGSIVTAPAPITKGHFLRETPEEERERQNEKVTTHGMKARVAIEGCYVREGLVLVDTDARGGCRLIVKTAFRFQSEALCPERALSSRHRELDNAESVS